MGYKKRKCIHTLKDFSLIISIEITSDSKYIITSFSNNIIKIWELSTGKLIYTINEYYQIAISKNGYFKGLRETIEKNILIKDTSSKNRKLSLDEIHQFTKKENFLTAKRKTIVKKPFKFLLEPYLENIDLDDIPF